jgi:hypothetical protein
MTTKLEPRVSILERGQEALQRELTTLTSSVKEQGAQLTAAISELAKAHGNSHKELIVEIARNKQTDWSTLLTGLGVTIALVIALSTPIWLSFNWEEKKDNIQDARISRIEDRVFLGAKAD